MKRRKRSPLKIIPTVCTLMIIGCVFSLIGLSLSPKPIDIAGEYKPPEERTEEELISAELNYEYNQKRNRVLTSSMIIIPTAAAVNIVYHIAVRRRNKKAADAARDGNEDSNYENEKKKTP